MFTQDWEKRWEKYGKELATSIHQQPPGKATEDMAWLSEFLQSSVLLTTMLLPSIVTFVAEFPIKLEPIDEKQWMKKLNKTKKEAVHHTIKIVLMDYFCSFLEHPVHALLFEQSGLSRETFDAAWQHFLGFSKEERQQYNELNEKKETYFPTIQFLHALHVKKDAKNEALLEGVEYFKNELFAQFDRNFQRLYPQKKD